MTAYQERVRREVREENVEIVYKFLRTHPDAAMRWVDTNRDHRSKPDNPEIEPGDPAYGFWEIYSPTGYTRDELGRIMGDDMDLLGQEIRYQENQ